MTSTSVDQPRTAGSVAARRGLVGALVLMAVAMLVPAIFPYNVRVNHFPPLHADWMPRVGFGTLPALVLGLLSWRYAAPMAARLTWGRLLAASFLGGLAWMLALAFVDGVDGIGQILDEQYEYLGTARATSDFPAVLQVYVSRISLENGGNKWPVHIAGHPPGALGFFVLLARLNLGSGFGAGLVVTVVAATTAVGVLVAMRVLGAEDLARRAAPFLVVGPAAIWQAVSADAMFAAVAAWGLAALAVAAVRRSIAFSVLAGLLLGYAVMCSYGLPLLGVLALTVLWLGRSWFPLGLAAVAALLVVAAFWVGGFSYLEALPAIRDRYFGGIGGRRPTLYWTWGGPAALLFASGPLLGASLAHLASRWRVLRADASARVVLWLSGAATASILIADATQMSKAEVERIWLPFVPWLLLSCALLPERWRSRGLALQIVFALVVQHLLHTGW